MEGEICATNRGGDKGERLIWGPSALHVFCYSDWRKRGIWNRLPSDHAEEWDEAPGSES